MPKRGVEYTILKYNSVCDCARVLQINVCYLLSVICYLYCNIKAARRVSRTSLASDNRLPNIKRGAPGTHVSSLVLTFSTSGNAGPRVALRFESLVTLD